MALKRTDLQKKTLDELKALASTKSNYDPAVHKNKTRLIAFLLPPKIDTKALLKKAEEYPDFKKTKHGKNKKTLEAFLATKVQGVAPAVVGDAQPVVEPVAAVVATTEKRKKEKKDKNDIKTIDDLDRKDIHYSAKYTLAKEKGFTGKWNLVEVKKYLKDRLPTPAVREGPLEIAPEQVVDVDVEVVESPPPVVVAAPPTPTPVVVAPPSPAREATPVKTHPGIAPININRLLDKPSEKEIRQAILNCLGLYHDDNDEVIITASV